jgi:hypothetical protein
MCVVKISVVDLVKDVVLMVRAPRPAFNVDEIDILVALIGSC